MEQSPAPIPLCRHAPVLLRLAEELPRELGPDHAPTNQRRCQKYRCDDVEGEWYRAIEKQGSQQESNNDCGDEYPQAHCGRCGVRCTPDASPPQCKSNEKRRGHTQRFRNCVALAVIGTADCNKSQNDDHIGNERSLAAMHPFRSQMLGRWRPPPRANPRRYRGCGRRHAGRGIGCLLESCC